MLVPEGFSWWGLVFGRVVLLRSRKLAGGAAGCHHGAGDRAPGACRARGVGVLPGLHLVVALFANDWRRWELGRAGYAAGPVVAGRDHGSALLRLLDLRPDLLGQPATVAP